VLSDAHRTIPPSLVHRDEAAAPDTHAATREPVRRIGEDDVHALCWHETHEIDAVHPVGDGPGLTVGFEVTQLHAVILGPGGEEL
jgi:hypothetical protein